MLEILSFVPQISDAVCSLWHLSATSVLIMLTFALSVMWNRNRRRINDMHAEIRRYEVIDTQYKQRVLAAEAEIGKREEHISALTALLTVEADQDAQYSRSELIDEKTKLPNERRGMIEIRKLCRMVAEEREKACCLIYFDLEGFKQINVRGMSWRGDIAIKLFARRLYARMRRDEKMFAWRRNTGGDEFLLLLRGREHEGTLGFLASVHRQTMQAFSEEVRILLSDPTFPTVGFRAGIVEISVDDAKIVANPELSPRREQEVIKSFISKAEQRCYRAQERKHNLRVIWHNMSDYEDIRDIDSNLADLNLRRLFEKLRAILASLRETDRDASSVQRLESEWRVTQLEARDILTLCYSEPVLTFEERMLIHSPWRDLVK